MTEAVTVDSTKAIRIACSSGIALPVDDLADLQGELKELSEVNFAKLSKEILATGFAFAPHAWKNPEDGKTYLVDGHQRVKTVKRLRDEQGFTVAPLPVVMVEASTIQEAKRRVLQATSQYGEMTPQGLYDFMILADIKLEDVKVSFDLPQVDLDKFSSFFSTPEPAPVQQNASSSSEISENDFSHLIHTCPSCGHQFGKGA